MATASLSIYSVGSTSCSYTATFTNYVGFGFYNITSGGNVYGSGMFSGTTATGTITGLSPSTAYTMLLTCADDIGSYYSSQSFTTAAQAPVRPGYFYWSTSKTSGYSFNVMAYEWNSFASNINAIRTYKGIGTYSFTYAYTGSTFYAYMFNQAIYAISSLTSVGVSTKGTGNKIYASDLNSLVNSLNSIT